MVDIATDASLKPASHPKPLRVGLDIGSTTVKAVVLDQSDSLGDTLFSDYRRHHANVRATVAGLLVDIHKKLVDLGRGDEPIRLSITGSGGLALADNLHVPFIQEVIAETEAIDKEYPQADVIIELGGEDAKITYLKPTPEQRMNGSCAGGTGAFIDQMSTLLDTDAAGLNEMAKSYENLYPIASRCGVFAKTDLQPLINDGAAKPDLAASIFTAVATQTIAGLASGRPIHGTVIFLGGPLFFMSELRAAFQRALEGKVDEFIVPTDAHLYVAYGSALQADTDSDDQGHHFEAYTCDEILKRLDELKNLPSNTPTMPPLFPTEADREDFNKRHHKEHIHIGTLEGAHGPHFLGIDAGSTTIKATLVNDDREIVWSSYANNEGSPLTAAINIVKKIQSELPEGAWIARSCATGYGEGLITTGLHLDEGVVETMAHYRGAEMVSPGVTAVIDIGGQDMKYLAITDGVIDSIAVNEACSSGCGSFLQTFAMSMGLTIQEFTQKALASTHPVDLGSRCTVFMNSSVKQAQKEGASIEDIAAGLCYSVVRNALYKVIKLRDSGELGDTVVVQGGTFLNDAVLRAFELLTEREVTRPNIAGLMGAFGAALTARMHYEDIADDDNAHVGADGRSVDAAAAEESAAGDEPNAAAHAGEIVVDGVRHTVSSILTGEALNEMSMTTERDVCKLCQNHCKLTITTFSDGSRFVTGNRCERGGDAKKKRSDRPNLYDYKYKRCFAYRRLTDKNATRGEIGIPRALNMYENYPFWFTLLTSLGFKVMISGRSSHELFETGIESIASENICYPAKLVHGHIKWLLNKGMKTIFYPCVSYEDNLVPNTDNHYNCPVVANYPLVVGANMPELRDPDVRYMHPYFNLANHELMVDRIVEEFAWASVSREEAETAVKAAYAEDKVFKHDVQQEGLKALAYMKEHDCRGIVLAGRPYHIDPEINHGIPETICALGMVVLSEDSICELQPGEKLDLTDFLSEGEEDPRKKNANGFRHVDDRKVTVNRMPLRVTNQWAYHSRLYAAAHFVASYPGLELVQLNSFGCGLDAITTDQVAEILADKADVYTLLKIDEVSNLGAAKIRLRSLKAAVEEREANKARMAKAALATSDESGSAESDAPRNAAHAAAQAAARKAQEQAESDLATAQAALAEAQAAVAAAEAKVKAADRPVDAADAGSDAAAPANAPKSTGFRKTGSKAPTPGRQVLLDATMAANPKLTKAMRDASKRAAKRDIADVRLAALGDGTTNDAANAKSKSAKSKSGHNNATMSRYAHREKFVKDMKKDYTIVAPQMSPIHFSLVESVIRSGGYKFDILKHASREDVETGLKYVNNDACYPAIMVIGQLIDAILEGKYDPDKVCLAITQTGGMCRATNYFGLIRKALIDAGYPQIPVIAISTQGLEDNPGFKVTPALLHRTVKALILGDLLMKCLYRVRPYEVEKGAANRLYEQWDVIVREALEHHGFSKTAAKTPWLKRRYLPYPVLAREIVKSFDALPLKDVPRKVRVGVVGEILVKYQPDANNHVVDVIESQDCEAVVPGIMEFMTTRPYITDWNEKYLGTGGNKTLYALMRWSLDRYNAPIKAAIATSHGKFKQDDPMPELVEKAAEVTSIGVQAGEGWLLTAEILELIEQGCPNVICAQPFACLPNHVTGRGMFGKIRRLHPEANIVSIDYDPGASEANQLNRIKLMIAAAKKAHKAKFADGDEPQGFTAAD
ncbi:acyl-CoA dehydratase activase-related protein [Bifidobacterium longum]|mgnify:FL=1|uniref:acyl-CoA dehydratase activase-related protein n=1 Tax=Bifidobacterium longum TaxID=216816 RepID=UPI0004D35419|nr:acyl-CoA dehydratase activase-related protein [Bifidobacterium longum]KEY29084.1 activase [Bifidobacterium longum subsp. longum 72B]MBV3437139.1 2-hydroxyacyl-CoA dehydratase [Bifidobacterium longum]MDL5569027.1 acyl-CoA dehydratase activase-related protein [Bifidobacterium longum]GHM78073.1 activase [Bifidobacterium longum subsp. longum]